MIKKVINGLILPVLLATQVSAANAERIGTIYGFPITPKVLVCGALGGTALFCKSLDWASEKNGPKKYVGNGFIAATYLALAGGTCYLLWTKLK